MISFDSGLKLYDFVTKTYSNGRLPPKTTEAIKSEIRKVLEDNNGKLVFSLREGLADSHLECGEFTAAIQEYQRILKDFFNEAAQRRLGLTTIDKCDAYEGLVIARIRAGEVLFMIVVF